MPDYQFTVGGKTHTARSNVPLTDAELSDVVSRYETPSKPRKRRTLAPDPQKQAIVNELQRRGALNSPEKQAVVRELQNRGVLAPSQPMKQVEIAGTGGMILEFPASMTDEQIGAVIRSHPQLRQMRAKALKATGNGDPYGDPALTGEPTTTRPLHQGDVIGSKARVTNQLNALLKEQGITAADARSKGISPAVNAAKEKQKQREQQDIDKQIQLAREREKHKNDELTPQNYATDKKRAEKVGKLNTLNASRAGSLLNRAIPHTDEILAEGKGVKGGLQKLAAGALETLPETIALGGLGKSLEIGNALGKMFAVQGAVGVAENAADLELAKRDPAQYTTLLIGNSLLAGSPFVKQWRENAIINQVADGKRSLPPKMASMIEQKAGLPKDSLKDNPDLARYAAQTITGKAVTAQPPQPQAKPAGIATPSVAQTPNVTKPTKTPTPPKPAQKTPQTPPAAESQAVVPDWLARLKKIVEEAEQTQTPESVTADTPEQLSKLHAGFNPLEAIADADNLDRDGFTVERGKGDFGIHDNLRSPLSTGEDMPGTYERIGGKEGKAVSDAMRDAQRGIESDTTTYTRQVDEINAYLDRMTQQRAGSRWTLPKVKKANRAKVDSEFIELIEKQKNDPERIAALAEASDRGEALRRHDALTETIRQEIIAERRQRGIQTPDDWGITESGFYHHAFLGDLVIRDKSGKTIGHANTYVEAQKLALDYLKQNPNAELTASARDIRAGDSTLRIGSKQYHRAVNEIAGTVNLSHQQIMADLRGIVGQEKNRSKFFGALEQRTGAKGYSENYSDVLNAYVQQTARWKGLNRLKQEVQPRIEKIRSEGQPGLAEAMENHLDALWGSPSKAEKEVGNLLRKIPILRNHVKNPDMAFRSLAQRITKIQSTLKLSYNVKSSAINLMQPLQTLWTKTSSREFASLYAESVKPSTRQRLRDLDVFDSGTKLEGNTPQRKGKLSTPFQAASNQNRAVGYLYGERLGKAQGLSPEQIHRSGMEWAEKVEFDNSVWNAPPALRSPGGRILGQFKGYTVKSAEMLFGDGGLTRRDPSIPKGEKAAGVLKYLAATSSVGGVKAVSMGGKLVGGAILVNGLQSALQSQGMSEGAAKQTAEAIYYGAPALLDMDLSASVSTFDIYDAPSGAPLDTFLRTVAGPNISTGFDLAQAGFQLTDAEDWQEAREIAGKAAQKLTPYAKQADAIQQQIQTGQVSVRGRGGKPVPLSKPGGILRALGIPPLENSRYWDARKEKK